ncbi:hypothetical protein ACWFMI_08290 [Nocardiopsis terrae]
MNTWCTRPHGHTSHQEKKEIHMSILDLQELPTPTTEAEMLVSSASNHC